MQVQEPPTGIVPQELATPPTASAGPQLRTPTLSSFTITLFRTSSPELCTTTVTLIGAPGPVASTHVLSTVSAGECGTLQVSASVIGPTAECEHWFTPERVVVSVS